MQSEPLKILHARHLATCMRFVHHRMGFYKCRRKCEAKQAPWARARVMARFHHTPRVAQESRRESRRGEARRSILQKGSIWTFT